MNFRKRKKGSGRAVRSTGLLDGFQYGFVYAEAEAAAKVFNPFLLFLGLVGSGLCYVLWNKAFRLLGVVATNNFIYLTPFVTIVTARLFLDESISALALLGAVLITIGVVASQWEPKKVAKSE